MDIFRIQRTDLILFTIYIMEIGLCHGVCYTEFCADKYEINCETLPDLDSIQNICKDYKCSMHLTQKNLVALPSNSFAKIPNVEAINMAGTIIQELNDGAFSGLLNIKEIILQQNNLTKISRNVFNHLPTLKVLDLSLNRINYLADGSFQFSNSIESLDLSFNQISYISMSMLRPLNILKILNVSNNALTSHALPNFCHVPLLKMLILDKNYFNMIEDCLKDTKLTHFSISDNFLSNLENMVFPTHLMELHLEGNYISELHTKSFLNLVNLKVLDISRNQIRSISKDTFENLKHLELLNIAENHITYLQQDIFKNLFNLKTLNFSHNSLLDIEFDALAPLTSLETLDMSDNQLVIFDVKFLNVFSQLRTFKISGNDLSCGVVSDILYNANRKGIEVSFELTHASNGTSGAHESPNIFKLSKNEEKLFIRKRSTDFSNVNLNSLEQTLKNLQKTIEELTGTMESFNKNLSGEPQIYKKFFASINNVSTNFSPDDVSINFDGLDTMIDVNKDTNVVHKEEKVTSPDSTKLEEYFHKFFNEFSSFLNRTEERNQMGYSQKQQANSHSNQLLLNKLNKEMVDDLKKEAKEMVAILSQLRLIVILFGLVLLLVFTVKTIKQVRNIGKQEYEGISMEMPIMNEGQHSRF